MLVFRTASLGFIGGGLIALLIYSLLSKVLDSPTVPPFECLGSDLSSEEHGSLSKSEAESKSFELLLFSELF